jgi:ABC-2 type transport system ATP-binding protein
MIFIDQVSKSFGSVKALESVTFKIDRGAVIGLLGPNGAGKTTLMRLITGYFAPSSGQILIDGEEMRRLGARYRKRVGYLAENNPLYKDMTTRSFLSHIASLKGVSLRNRRHAIEHVIEQCGIATVYKRTIGKLSKGYQQRIGLAQALMGDPEILILDEPTTGLDPGQIIEIRNLIRKIGETRTVLLSTHILPEARMTCQKILILSKGRLVAEGTCEDLENRLKGACEFSLTVSGAWQSGDPFLKFIPGVLEIRLVHEAGRVRQYLITAEKNSEIRTRVAKAVLDAGFELHSLKPAEWNLEDIFLKIVTSESAGAKEVLTC